MNSWLQDIEKSINMQMSENQGKEGLTKGSM